MTDDQSPPAQTPAAPPNAAAIGGPQRQYAPCPCGKVPEQLILEVPQQGKVGYAVCGICAQWRVEFYRGLQSDPEAILDSAHKAWDAAPRPSGVAE